MYEAEVLGRVKCTGIYAGFAQAGRHECIGRLPCPSPPCPMHTRPTRMLARARSSTTWPFHNLPLSSRMSARPHPASQPATTMQTSRDNAALGQPGTTHAACTTWWVNSSMQCIHAVLSARAGVQRSYYLAYCSATTVRGRGMHWGSEVHGGTICATGSRVEPGAKCAAADLQRAQASRPQHARVGAAEEARAAQWSAKMRARYIVTEVSGAPDPARYSVDGNLHHTARAKGEW